MSHFKLLKKKHQKDININLDVLSDDISLVKVSCHNYIGYNIFDGDVLVIDKNAELYDGAKVFVRIQDKECIKIYRIIGDFPYLQTSFSCILPVEIGDLKYEIMGVITNVVRCFSKSMIN
jgi:SOS-response transcriptional repressor LexA